MVRTLPDHLDGSGKEEFDEVVDLPAHALRENDPDSLP